jgi:hypothetical protein
MKAANFKWSSIAVYECADVSDTAQPAVYGGAIHVVFITAEEFAVVVPMNRCRFA